MNQETELFVSDSTYKIAFFDLSTGEKKDALNVKDFDFSYNYKMVTSDDYFVMSGNKDKTEILCGYSCASRQEISFLF